MLPVDDEPGRWDGQEDSKSVAGLDGHLGADLGVVGRVGAPRDGSAFGCAFVQ